jgi:hypothetical protein
MHQKVQPQSRGVKRHNGRKRRNGVKLKGREAAKSAEFRRALNSEER